MRITIPVILLITNVFFMAVELAGHQYGVATLNGAAILALGYVMSKQQ